MDRVKEIMKDMSLPEIHLPEIDLWQHKGQFQAIVVMLLLAEASRRLYEFILSHWRQTEGDHWMIVLRNGEPVK